MTRIQVRRDTSNNWTTANPTLSAGEWGLETDTKLRKLGDGTTAWTSLAYQPEGSVKSVNTRTPNSAGAITTLVKGDVGLGSVDNTTDAAKPVSTAQSTAIAAAVAAATPRTILQNTNGTWPGRSSVPCNRTTAVVTWEGTAPGPQIGTGVDQAVSGLDVQFVTAVTP